MSHPGLSTETIAPFDTRRIRTALVDDQELVRAGLSFIISTEPGIDVVAEAANGELGVVAALSHRPDLVLMDIRMPVMDGITATARLRDADGPPVLVLTTFDDDDVLWGAVQAGAAGFLLKDTPAHDLIHAIRVVAAGGSWLDPRVTPRLLEVLRTSVRASSQTRTDLERLPGHHIELHPWISSSGALDLCVSSSLVASRGSRGEFAGECLALQPKQFDVQV